MNDQIDIKPAIEVELPDSIFMNIGKKPSALSLFIRERKNKAMRERILLNAPEETNKSAHELRLRAWQESLQQETKLGSIFLDLEAFVTPGETEFLEPPTLEEIVIKKIQKVERAVKERIKRRKLEKIKSTMDELSITREDIAEYFELTNEEY